MQPLQMCCKTLFTHCIQPYRDHADTEAAGEEALPPELVADFTTCVHSTWHTTWQVPGAQAAN